LDSTFIISNIIFKKKINIVHLYDSVLGSQLNVYSSAANIGTWQLKGSLLLGP
jgi:hypothetical protein